MILVSAARWARRWPPRRNAARTNASSLSRAFHPGLRDELQRAGVETIAADLLDRERCTSCAGTNVIFMAVIIRRQRQSRAYLAMNVHVPALVAEYFSRSASSRSPPAASIRSFGDAGGATETTPPDPPGEYAMTCVGASACSNIFRTARHAGKAVPAELRDRSPLRRAVRHCAQGA